VCEQGCVCALESWEDRWHYRLTLIILAIQEAEIRRIAVRSQPG
jgi:hypothetical protein